MISPQIKKLNARMFLHGIVNRISGYGRYISHIELAAFGRYILPVAGCHPVLGEELGALPTQ